MHLRRAAFMVCTLRRLKDHFLPCVSDLPRLWVLPRKQRRTTVVLTMGAPSHGATLFPHNKRLCLCSPRRMRGEEDVLLNGRQVRRHDRVNKHDVDDTNNSSLSPQLHAENAQC